MDKWADYLISAVRYNPQHTHIVKVKRHLDTGEGVATFNIINKILVVKDLIDGKTYKTAYQENDGKWREGEDVRLVANTGFITTDPNTTTRDNLGNLPEF